MAEGHSLRHTCGTWLGAAGVQPKVIRRIMRHSTIRLTVDRSTHAFRSDETAAVAKLTDLSDVACNKDRATGSDGFAGRLTGHIGRTEVDPGAESVDSRGRRVHSPHRPQPPAAQGRTAITAVPEDRPRRDSNPRITDLQSVPLVRLGTRPRW